jgi:hypothetical protein
MVKYILLNYNITNTDSNIIREATEAGIDPVLALEAAKVKIENAIAVQNIVSGKASFNYIDKTITKL